MPPFNPIPALAILVVLSLVGIVAGHRQWRRPGLRLMLAASLLFVLVGLKLWFPWRAYDPPLSWLLAGRRECYLLALACPLLLWGLVSMVRNPVLRGVVIFTIGVIWIGFAYLPIVAICWGEAAGLSSKTSIDKDGVCRQATGITCGPAAGVTVLRRQCCGDWDWMLENVNWLWHVALPVAVGLRQHSWHTRCGSSSTAH